MHLVQEKHLHLTLLNLNYWIYGISFICMMIFLPDSAQIWMIHKWAQHDQIQNVLEI